MTASSVTSALATSLPHSTGPEATKLDGRPPLRLRHPDLGEAADSSDSDQYGSDSEGETTAVDDVVPEDNYVRKVLAKERPLPPITLKNLHKNINVISTLALTVVPLLSIYGALTTEVKWQTALWAVLYYFYTGLG
jgi:stearoyl-CoA desaturase (delta-9 desaturase)